MASIFTSSIQSHILSLLVSKLPLHTIDIPQQSNLNFGGASGPSLDLHDLKLDIEKLESQYFPPNAPFNVRSAFLKNLNIVISRNGIQLNLSNIKLEVSPKVGAEASQFLDPSGSIFLRSLDDPLEGLEGMMGSVVGFVDAVSGVSSFASGDNQNHSVYDDEINDEEEEQINKRDIEGIPKPESLPNGGTQNSIVKYTIEYILGKISVQILNLEIVCKTDPLILNLNMEKITANGDNEDRKCTISGVQLSVFDPTLNSMNGVNENFKGGDVSSVKQSGVLKKENDVEFEDAMMTSSFMATSKMDMEQSMIDSAMYSTGRSVYMSAIANSNMSSPNVSAENDPGSVFLTLDVIEISLKDRRVLSININSIKVSLVELPVLMISLVSILIDMNMQDFRKPNQLDLPQKSSNSPILDQFLICELQIGLNSSLVNGNFDEKSTFILFLKDILLTRRSSTLMQGSLQTLRLQKAETKQIYFIDKLPNTADITLEIQKENFNCSFSFLTNKTLKLEISFDLLKLIAKYINEFDPLWEKMNELHVSNIKLAKTSIYNRAKGLGSSSIKQMKAKTTKVSHKFTINTADTEIIVYLDDASQARIKLHCAPIVSNAFKDIIAVDHIKSEVITPKGNIDLQVNKIRYVNHGKELAKFKDYDLNLQKPIMSSTKQTISIDLADCDSEFESLLYLQPILEQLTELFSVPVKTHKQVQFEKKTLFSMSSSAMFNIKRHILYIIVLKTNLKLVQVNNQFGDVRGSIENLKFTKSIDGDSNISVAMIGMQRQIGDFTENIISVSNPTSMLPPIYVRIQTTYHIFLNNLILWYSGKWLAMFDSANGKNELPKLKTVETTNTKKKLLKDMHLTMRNVAIGLRAVSLDSAAILQLENSGVEILLYSDQSLITQLTTNVVNIFLIDDYSKRKQVDDTDNLRLLDGTQIWEAIGYKHVGRVMTLLAKFNIEPNKIKTIASRVGESIPKTLLDIQVNIDSLKLFMCSDSFQCFLQLLKDLKKPIYFSYEDKYKDKSETLNLLDEIEENFFDATIEILSGTTNNKSEGEVVEEEPEELHFVEDYYDQLKSSSGEKKDTVTENNVRSSLASTGATLVPIDAHVSVSRFTFNLHDGYDWKETRDQIQSALERVIEKANEVRVLKESINDDGTDKNVEIVVEETLYRSILVEAGPNDNPSDVYNEISKNVGGFTLEKLKTVSFGKKYPLVLERSQKNKVSIRLNDVDVDFKLLSTDEMHLKEKPTVFTENIDENDSVKVFQLDVNVSDFQVIDNVPTSSWHMFAGYMREAGEREIGKNILQLSVEAVRPIDVLAAVEMIVDVKLLPLRLHVDQDALDFLTRFFDFKDSRFVPNYGEMEEQFIQKLVVDTVKIKLDYKPKAIDYAGLRSGKTGEFVNFFVLDGADITLKKVKIYGILGFSKLNSLLSAQWSPDVKKNQLNGVLSGLAPVRSFYNIGYNINNSFSIPINEYRRDGSVVRGILVGATTFTKATGSELLKLGAKLAAGTQAILENAEQALGGSGSYARIPERKNRSSSSSGSNRSGRRRSSAASFGDEDERDYHKYYRNKVKLKQKNIDILGDRLEEECAVTDDENDGEQEGGCSNEVDKTGNTAAAVSLYANQPASLNEGLKVALRSVQRNFKTATNAVYEASVRASVQETTTGAFVEMAKVTPIIVIRPVIAATEAVSKTLLGGVNELNPEEKEKSDEKYKPVNDSDDILSDSD